MKSTDQAIALKVSLITIIINIALTILKFFSGIFSHSQAIISDAVHSASDVFSTIIVIIGIKVSSKKADKEHQYGHERLECVAALILAFILFIVGFQIGITGIKNIFMKSSKLAIPGLLALITALISIIVKEIMFWYTKKAAKKINSGALLADAWHHRSDALSSIGSLLGIVGARAGYVKLDSLASIAICLCIIKIAYQIFKDSIDKMIDKACDDNILKKIEEITYSRKDIIQIDDIKSRVFGNKIYIDLEISVNEDISILDAHQIAEELHDSIEENIPEIKHCMIHVNPISVINS